MDININNLQDSYLSLFENAQCQLNINPQEKDGNKLKEACRQFEAIFIRQMLKEMRKTIPKGGLLPESNERAFFTSMFDEKIAEEISQQGRMGLADLLFRQLKPQVLDTDNNGDKELDRWKSISTR